MLLIKAEAWLEDDKETTWIIREVSDGWLWEGPPHKDGRRGIGTTSPTKELALIDLGGAMEYALHTAVEVIEVEDEEEEKKED